MRSSTRRCPAFSSGLAEMISKYSVLWETSLVVKHLITKASPALLNFTKSTARYLQPEQKMYASFRRVRGLGYMTVPEMLKTMHENDLFDMFPVLPNAVHILRLMPATFCCAERSFSALRRLKTYLRSSPWATTCQ